MAGVSRQRLRSAPLPSRQDCLVRVLSVRECGRQAIPPTPVRAPAQSLNDKGLDSCSFSHLLQIEMQLSEIGLS